MNIKQLVCALYESDTMHARDVSVQTAAYLIKGPAAVQWLGERRSGHLYGTPARLGWERLYLLGCNPAEIRRTWGGAYAFPITDPTSHARGWGNHPLHIASLMLHAGRHHDAAVALDEYRLIREYWKKPRPAFAPTPGPENPFPRGFFPNNISNHEWTSQPICPINPRAHGLEPLAYDPSMDRIAFALWYEKDSFKERFETIRFSYHLRVLRSLVEVGGEDWRRLVAARAGVFLRKEMRRKRTSYDDVALAIRAAGEQRASEILRQTAHRSTRAAFALLPWASSKEMRTALTEVAKLGESSQTEVLRRMGRPPTADELLSVRNKGLVDVLRRMPWEFLEPAATGPDKSKLVARMAKYFKTHDLDVMREVLVPHDGRLGMATLPAPLPEGVVALEPSDTAWGELAQRYEDARRYNLGLRMRLLHIADEDPYAAILLTLVAMRKAELRVNNLITPSIAEIAAELPGYPVILEDVEAFRPKLPKDL